MNQNQDLIDVGAISDAVAGATTPIDICGVGGSERGLILTRMYARQPRPMVVVTASIEDSQRLAEDLSFFNHQKPFPVLFFPSYPLLTFKFLSYHSATAAERIRVLYRLLMD
jgi:transcription-repair coupling factor (superfamily II helicase)